MSIKSRDDVRRSALGSICALALVLGAARGEEEPFAKDEGETPAESLRKALRKMSRVEESAKAWLEKKEEAETAPRLLAGIETRQKELAEDLSRLVLKLQKG